MTPAMTCMYGSPFLPTGHLVNIPYGRALMDPLLPSQTISKLNHPLPSPRGLNKGFFQNNLGLAQAILARIWVKRVILPKDFKCLGFVNSRELLNQKGHSSAGFKGSRFENFSCMSRSKIVILPKDSRARGLNICVKRLPSSFSRPRKGPVGSMSFRANK